MADQNQAADPNVDPNVVVNNNNLMAETDLRSHIWFELRRFFLIDPESSKALNPLTTNLKEWITYWHERALIMGVAPTIEKAMRYLAPKSKNLFNEAIAMSRLKHRRDDWDLFEATVRNVFQVTKADIIQNPLRDPNWLIKTKVTNTRTPRNQALRAHIGLALKPLVNLSDMLFNDQRFIRQGTFDKAMTWMMDLRLFPEDMYDQFEDYQVQQGDRVMIMLGMAIALQLNAIAQFKYNNIPAHLMDPFDDIMETMLHLRENNDACFFEDTVDALATYLTTQSNISGASQAEKDVTTKKAIIQAVSQRAQTNRDSGKANKPQSNSAVASTSDKVDSKKGKTNKGDKSGQKKEQTQKNGQVEAAKETEEKYLKW